MYIESGRYRKVVVIGADKMSAIVDYSDRTTSSSSAMGQAASCSNRIPEGFGVLDSILRKRWQRTDPPAHEGRGLAQAFFFETVAAKRTFYYQEGQAVFKFAVKGMADVSAELLERNHLTGEDISWLVPHQANKRIIDATASRMGLSSDKVMVNIQRYGNTTSGTIPLCLWTGKAS